MKHTRHILQTIVLATALVQLGQGSAWAQSVVTGQLLGNATDGYYVNMPKANTPETAPVIDLQTVFNAGVTSIKVYDDGGSDGNYSNNCDGYLLLTAPEGYGFSVSGTVTSEFAMDFLYVYEGTDTASQIGRYASTTVSSLRCRRNMLLRFKSISRVTNAGIDLTVSFIKAYDFSECTVSSVRDYYVFTGNNIYISPVVKASDGTTLSNKSDYNTNISSVRDKGDYTLTITALSPHYGTLTVPFTVGDPPEVQLAEDNDFAASAPGHWYVNMPTDLPNNLTLGDAGIARFKVYDDGGKNGDYSFPCDGSLTIIAPTGYVIQLSGTVCTRSNAASLSVYDSDGSTLIDKAHSTRGLLEDVFTGELMDPDFISVATISTGNRMSLAFSTITLSDYTASGLDLTVTLINASHPSPITINDVPGGTVSSSPTEAIWKAPVTLTAAPAAGYLLADIVVMDAYGNPVPVEGGWHTGNQVTFNMPGSAATVTPVFTNNPSAEGGLYVNMPVKGTQALNLPDLIESFKLYDDGGKDGLYSNDCDGLLILTAPAGNRLMLSGNILTENASDYLYVYDGDGIGSQVLINAKSSTSHPDSPIELTPVETMSTGQNMTIRFTTNVKTQYDGLDLTVEVFNNDPHAITINTTGNGNATARVSGSTVTQASYGQAVILNLSPAMGHIIARAGSHHKLCHQGQRADRLWRDAAHLAARYKRHLLFRDAGPRGHCKRCIYGGRRLSLG